jgi:hypothetical protein
VSSDHNSIENVVVASIDCGSCGVPAGKRCRASSGEFAAWVHKARRDAYEELQEALKPKAAHPLAGQPWCGNTRPEDSL